MRGCFSSAWLRSFLQPVTYLGVGMSLLILAGLFYLISRDREAAYSAALQNGDNLARVFEGHISRTIKSADNTLLYLRKSYQRDPAISPSRPSLRIPSSATRCCCNSCASEPTASSGIRAGPAA